MGNNIVMDFEEYNEQKKDQDFEELSKLELHQVGEKVKELLKHFDDNKEGNEKSDNWYCGVTGQEKSDDEFELKRIEQHYNDKFPELDEDSIGKVKVTSVEVAMEVEKRMEVNNGFDIGTRQKEPVNENKIWVYIFRKIT